MKIFQNKKQLLVFYMLGFFAGILYANLISRQYLMASGIFNEYFLKQYAQTDVVLEEYVWYIIGVRAVPFAVFALLGFTRIRKVAAAGLLIWTGFSCGMVTVASVIKLGIKGIVLCIVGITPQFFFYVPAYMILIWYFYTYPQSRWNNSKTMFILTAFLIGVVMEGYVNPILMKAFIGVI